MGFTLATETTLPLYLNEISTPGLGVALECLDDNGNLNMLQISPFNNSF